MEASPVDPSPEPTTPDKLTDAPPHLVDGHSGGAASAERAPLAHSAPMPPEATFPLRPRPVYRRRIGLPLFLFLVTGASTFWAGAAGWEAPSFFLGGAEVARHLVFGWEDGLQYMACVMAILLAHEMGHFLMTVWHRIPASWPIFIPMPITPLGTMGAVIAMRGAQADRKQLFDIGLAGPIAGLVVALPITYWGIERATSGTDPLVQYHHPLLVKLLLAILHPEYQGQIHMNPVLMAGWVGLLVTGLNMLPVSQLDGGHVSYALFGRRADWLAIGLVVTAIIFMLVTLMFMWVIMLGLILLIGVRHPPTANDSVPLGRVRTVLGYASLVIPVLCFPPQPMTFSDSMRLALWP
jgi:Zn-dependent protease